MWNFLKSDSPDSSLRVNMFLVTMPIGAMLWAVVFHIIYRTVVPVMTVVTVNPLIKHTYTLKVTYDEIPWLALATFVGGILAALFTMWYGKKLNKEAENEAPKPGDPAQPNKNVNPAEIIQP